MTCPLSLPPPIQGVIQSYYLLDDGCPSALYGSVKEKCEFSYGKLKNQEKFDEAMYEALPKLCQNFNDNELVEYPIEIHKSFWSRMKLLCRRESPEFNEHFQRLQRISLLGKAVLNFQAQNTLQLKNQLKVYLNLEKHYVALYKGLGDALLLKPSRFDRIFLFFIRPLIRYIYPAQKRPENIGLESLNTVAENIYAEVGEFSIKDQRYKVRAYGREYVGVGANRGRGTFEFTGKTYFGIYKAEETSTAFDLHSRSSRHSFSVLFGRPTNTKNLYAPFDRTFEDCVGNRACYDNQKYKSLQFSPEFRDMSSNETTRLLDDKLLQIMIEVGLQNRVSFFTSDSHRADRFVFITGGLRSYSERRDKKLLTEILNLRNKKTKASGSESLDYPAARNLGSQTFDFEYQARISAGHMKNKNVYLYSSEPQSWEEIIRKSPILTQGGGRIPEYWSKRPNIVELTE